MYEWNYRVIYILVRVLVYRYHALVGGVNVGLSSFLSLSLDFFSSLFLDFLSAQRQTFLNSSSIVDMADLQSLTGRVISRSLNLYLFVLIEQNKCHPNPCRNGGTCTGINEGEGFECTCREGFKGKNCEGEDQKQKQQL